MDKIATPAGPCFVWAGEHARCLLVQPVDENDLETMDEEISFLSARAGSPFLLAAYPVKDWNADLSPWSAPPVFGREGFAGQSEQTLARLESALLPFLQRAYSPLPQARLIVGGYSLAGLFALWAGHVSPRWDGVAAASPSVWFPGFLEFAQAHPALARAVYLSLGDREEKAKNPVMAQVGNRIRALEKLYQTQSGLSAALEWNPGNHFQQPALRTAKAFLWTMGRLP